jgi:UDP-3-O-[3-hydroxymyristoyl] glucosamine N-acyltransferase
MDEKVLTVEAIARRIGATVRGDGSVMIRGVNSLDAASAGELTFAADEKRCRRLAHSQASAAVVPADCDTEFPCQLRVDHVEKAWASVLALFAPEQAPPAAGVHPTACVDDSAELGQGVSIGPHCVIGANVRVGSRGVLAAGVVVESGCVIGDDCLLHPQVVLRARCRLGDRVQIGPGSVVGHDGFGYYQDQGEHRKVPHIGNVILEDDVELGACVCVDRAKFGSTRVGAGTKVDNLVQIAHNVQIGPGCILVGQCGLAGSARLGSYVTVGGSAGIRDNISLGDQASLAAYSAAAQDIPAGQTYAGVPAGPARDVFRVHMAGQKLPDMLKRVKALESRLEKIESAKDH